MNTEKDLGLEREKVLNILTIQGIIFLGISALWVSLSTDLTYEQLTQFQLIDITWGILGGVGLVLLSALTFLSSVDIRKCMGWVDRILLKRLKFKDIPYIALVSAVSEEVFFRGVLHNTFGIVIASLLFGLMHVPIKHMWPYGLWTAMAGFYLSYLYDWTGSLFVVILIHFMNNAVALYFWLKYRHRFLEKDEEDTV